jgi:hypothetical protein
MLYTMVSQTEQLQFVQHQLGYHFRDVSRLVLCFKAAHRSAYDEVAEDGNRALAQFGVTIMEMVEKRYSSVVGTEPRCMIRQELMFRGAGSLTLGRHRSEEGRVGEQQRKACGCV